MTKTNEMTHCPNCNTELKDGFMSSVTLLDQKQTKLINEYHEHPVIGYCSKCGKELYHKYSMELRQEVNGITRKLEQLIGAVPVISTHSPLNWDYKILSMVTGQSTTGTGVISEFTSSFTDLFGMQSGRHNRKLKAGEDMCFAQLRKQAIDEGGNAVIATDIDYSELGDGKGMIMVCMAGTAVKLENTDVLGEEKSKSIDALVELNKRLRYLSKYVNEDL